MPTFGTRSAALVWLSGAVVLVIAHVVTYAMSPGSAQLTPTFLQSMFMLDFESNVPTWWSTLQLAFVGLLWLRIAQSARGGSPPDRRLAAAALLIFGAAMFGSLDEAGLVHEKIGFYTSDSLLPRTGYWLFLYVPVLLALAIAVVGLAGRQLWSQRRALAWIAVGGALYLFAAGGLELTLNFIEWFGTAELLESFLEEAGELFGVWMILWGSLQMRDAFTATAGELASS
jgi:hypothetical protein